MTAPFWFPNNHRVSEPLLPAPARQRLMLSVCWISVPLIQTQQHLIIPSHSLPPNTDNPLHFFVTCDLGLYLHRCYCCCEETPWPIVLIGGWLTVPEACHHGEGAWLQAPWVLEKLLRATSWSTGGDRQTLELVCALETPKPWPRNVLSPTRPHLLILLIFSNSSITWWLSIQI